VAGLLEPSFEHPESRAVPRRRAASAFIPVTVAGSTVPDAL
jgi:hypothetical protein